MPGERLRAGFQSAAHACSKQIGMEAFGVGPDAAASKMARIVGEAADLNPRWELLETIVRRGDVGPLLDVIQELAGVRISWRRVSPDDLRGEAVREVQRVAAQLDLALEKIAAADALEDGQGRAAS